ncbi:MAG TPA: hypothetical protein VKA44_04720 [Gemmatimonadota bacterium]|nr:hypothetical protein [Gemmatimonadota bacterium]
MSGRRIAWVAWRITDAGAVETRITLEGPDGLERDEAELASLEAAAERFGESFREVAERVLATGSRSGRWRP